MPQLPDFNQPEANIEFPPRVYIPQLPDLNQK